MKNQAKRLWVTFLLLSASGSAVASPNPAPNAATPAEAGAEMTNSELCSLPDPKPSATFTATMANIRDQVMKYNYQIVDEFNKVSDAKYTVNKAQDSLIPGISVTGLSTIASNPTFAVTAIQILLPFLIPSNWESLYASQNAFNAEKQAYYVTELNTYASTLAIYFTILSDRRVMQAWQANAEASEQIMLMEQQNLEAGLTSVEAAAQAQKNYSTAQSNATGAVSVFCKDYSALAQALVLDPTPGTGTEISFEQSDLDEITDTSPGFENENINTLENQALSVAPEVQQLKDLIDAANNDKWAGALGFISSASIGVSSQAAGSTSGTPTNVSFTNPRGTVTGGFSFATFAEYNIAQDNIAEVVQQMKEVTTQSKDTIDINVADLNSALYQLKLDSNAENVAIKSYNNALAALNQGLSSKMAAYTQKAAITALSLNRIKDQAFRDLSLVTLYRATLSGPFAAIKGCQANSAPKSSSNGGDNGGFFGWLGGLFGNAPSEANLIALCAAPNGVAK